MNYINMAKYGFDRSPMDDFSDDGTRFLCYRHKDAPSVRISKAKHHDEVYISARIDRGLDWEMYSKLPHYKAMDKLNGVSQFSLTDDDLKQFAEDCIAYNKEYQDVLDNLVYPTLDEIKDKQAQLQRALREDYEDMLNKVKSNPERLIELSAAKNKKYEFGYMMAILDYYRVGAHKELDDLTDLVNTYQSVKFVNEPIKHLYEYESFMQIWEGAY